MSKADYAKELFEGGCNCCQAVFCAFLENTNMTMAEAMRLMQDEEALRRMSENLERLARPNAAEDIVDEILKLLE